MKEIIELIPVLAIAIVMNMAAGLYYNIGKKEIAFSWKTFMYGIIKAAVVAALFIGTAYCFDVVDLSSAGVTPQFVMSSAITLYVVKALVSLSKILGVNIDIK